jgi:hypothetical protein
MNKQDIRDVMVTGIEAGQPGIRSSFPGTGVIFSTPSLPGLGPNSLLASGYKRTLSEGRGCEVNYLYLFKAETKNAWNYTSIIHFMEWCSIKHTIDLYFLPVKYNRYNSKTSNHTLKNSSQ